MSIDIRHTIQRLNAVSPSFCLAKWLQVTLHLHTGETHSCHHPTRHAIDPTQLKENPSALHNTEKKLQARKEMLEGTRPGECDYCWNIEDASPDNLSDRHFKSNDTWAEPHLNQIKATPWSKSLNPTYVEVNFTNTCNFKCGYCEPNISSSWTAEARQHGPFVLGDLQYNDIQMREREGITVIEDEEKNPYIKAFWEWWPDLVKTLRVFRVTGGEPLLSRNTFKIIERLRETPAPQLAFAINSNLGVSAKIIDSFTEAMRGLLPSPGGNQTPRIQSFELYTSLDTWGADAEYIRHGLNLELFQRNVEHVLKNLEGFKLIFMVTFNLLSFQNFTEFLKYVMELRRRAREEFKTGNEILIDISYLRHPNFFAIRHLTEDFQHDGEEILRFLLKNRIEENPDGFYETEIEKMRRLLTWMRTPMADDVRDYSRMHFYKFAKEHDRRRGTDFLKTFPRYEKFFDVCKQAAHMSGYGI